MRVFTVLFLSMLFFSFASPASAAGSLDKAITVETLVHHIDRLWRGTSSQTIMTMTVKTQRYERDMTMEAWSKGKDYSLIVIRKPIKDQNIATLKVESNIWNYLPKINRVTKVPSSMMSGAWMGSHFTNDDLIRESTFEDDYTSSITFQGERDHRDIYELTSLPQVNAAVVWGRVVMTLDQKTLVPLHALYYDEFDELIRTITFDQAEFIEDRWIPMRMTLQPEDKPTESTVILYEKIHFNIALKPSFFSLKNLQGRRL